MEIVQTGTDTWPWCMSMFGARFAVFVRRARVLLTPCHATRNLCVLEVSPAPSTLLFQLVVSLDWYGLVRKFHKMEIVQTGTNTWRWCMSMFGARFAVFVRRARVLPTPCPATRNLCVLEVSPAPSHCCFNSLCYWNGTGWCENSTRWKSCKQVQTRGSGA